MTNRQPQFRGGDAGGNGDFVRYGAVIIENRVGLTGMPDVQRARVEWNASFRDPVSVWLALFADCAPQNRFVPVFPVETPLPVRIAGKMELFSVFADGETFLKQTLSRPVTAVEVAAVDDLVVAFAEQLGDVDTQNAVLYSAKLFAQADKNGLLKVERIAQTFLHKKRNGLRKRIFLSKPFAHFLLFKTENPGLFPGPGFCESFK